MWKVPTFLNPYESISLEMVLIDEKGGEIHVSIRILIKPDIYEVESFKDSIVVHGIENESKVPLIGECAKPSLQEEFLRMHPKKTLDELINLSHSGIFVVCAEVVRIVDGQDWWYPTSNCHKSVIPDGGSYFCSACDRHVFHVIPRKYLVLFDLESDVDSYGSDDTADVETMEFVKVRIITPPMTRGKDEIESNVAVTLKRNLSKAFDKVAKGSKKVKIEKD